MVWELLGLAVCGLLIGALGRLAAPGPHPAPWPRTLLLGLGTAVGGGLLASLVLGTGHRTITLLVAVGLAAMVVAVHGAFHHARQLPPG